MQSIRRIAATAAVMTTLLAVLLTTSAAPTAAAPTQATVDECVRVSIQAQLNGSYVRTDISQADEDHAVLHAGASSIGSWEKYKVCNGPGYQYLIAEATGQYVSADLGWYPYEDEYGILHATATAIGPWEKFTIACPASYCTIQLQANGRYVAAEFGWTGDSPFGKLRARATAIGSWEKFSIEKL